MRDSEVAKYVDDLFESYAQHVGCYYVAARADAFPFEGMVTERPEQPSGGI